jgi:hypothetical protein
MLITLCFVFLYEWNLTAKLLHASGILPHCLSMTSIWLQQNRHEYSITEQFVEQHSFTEFQWNDQQINCICRVNWGKHILGILFWRYKNTPVAQSTTRCCRLLVVALLNMNWEYVAKTLQFRGNAGSHDLQFSVETLESLIKLTKEGTGHK